MYPKSCLYGDWVPYALFFTLPVSVLSFGIRYSGMDSEILIVVVIQLIMFLLTWYLLYRLLKNRVHEAKTELVNENNKLLRYTLNVFSFYNVVTFL